MRVLGPGGAHAGRRHSNLSTLTPPGFAGSDQGDGAFSYTRTAVGASSPCDDSPCQRNGLCADDAGAAGYVCSCPAGFSGQNCVEDIDECASNPCYSGHTESCLTRHADSYECQCTAGYSGFNCLSDVDECLSHPCRYGHCSAGRNGLADYYECDCRSGWTGTNCNEAVDECDSSPCRNRAGCTDGSNRYTCACEAGYSGMNCAFDIDECGSHPCLHNGACMDRVDAFGCRCESGWSGGRCEEDVDECTSAPCGDHGVSCADEVNSYHCSCEAGYSGENCQVDIDECGSHPCLHNGACTDGVDAFECACESGWSGGRCEEDVDECTSAPCGDNAASCFDGVNGYTCTCVSGWSGLNCMDEINLCRAGTNHCDPVHSNCIHTGPGTDVCECHPGYSSVDSGLSCVEINECDSSPCVNHGRCTDVLLSYTCQCLAGYEGANCETDTAECNSSPCAHGACIDAVDAYSCACSDGWESSNCDVDTDDCASEPCEHGARCVDHLLAYSCECTAGWAGGAGGNCDVDIDECASVPCLHRVRCTDAIDMFTCTCEAGWAGGLCDENVEECASNPCSNGGVCSDGIAEYSCACQAGWSGENCGTNVDECSSTPCRNSGVCTDMIAEYACSCEAGWAGENCGTNMDECGSSPCAHGSRCLDAVDAYSCSCRPGWTGENCEVNIDDCSSSPCEHESSCSDDLLSYACDCRIGWAGHNCAENIDDCMSSPCQHSALCDDTGDTRADRTGYLCGCDAGYGGENCLENLDECASAPCGNATTGLCLDRVANYTCSCAAGWLGENCDSSEAIVLEMEVSIENFDQDQFVRDVRELLHLGKGDRVVIESVHSGSVVVTFHVVGRSVTAVRVVAELQAEVQTAADHGGAVSLGGAPVMAVDGRRPFVEDNSVDCNHDAYFFDGPTANFQNFTGVVAGSAFLMLMLSAMEWIRRQHYQTFIRCHIVFALLGFYSLFFHFKYGKLDVMAPFMLALLVDYAIRGWLLFRSDATIARRTQIGDSLVVLEVTAPAVQARHHEAGQYCFVRLPHSLQWHPITIASAPGAEKMMFVVKGLGDWSGQMLGEAGEALLPAGAAVGLDGPYGRLSVQLARHTSVVLIAGGVGVTPMLSVLAGLCGGKGPKAWLVWSVREPALAEKFAPLFQKATAAGHRITIHCTAAAAAAGGAARATTNDNPLVGGDLEEAAVTPPALELQPGRPDVGGILREAAAGGASEVAVLACGPSVMVEAAKVGCITEGGKDCRFEFHSELFEW